MSTRESSNSTEMGTYLASWGTKGTGPGQFDLPHAIDTDRNRRLYVADRTNARIQVFDENWQISWTHGRTSGSRFTSW